jgi:long-chain fatty acid transport protein
MKKLLAFSCLVLSSAYLLASGFSILEQSVGGLGRGLAGMTASTDDPSALYFNPAGAAWVERPTLNAGTHLLTGKVKFHDSGSTISGHESGDIIRKTYIPNLDYSIPIGDGLNLNLAASATSGTATNYHKNWMGRYHGIDTSIAVVEVLPSVSYRLTDNFAVGVGLMIDYAEMKALQKIPTAQYGHDTKLRTEGDDIGLGFTLGVVWKPCEGTTLGLGYRSRSTYELDMDAKFYYIPELVSRAYGIKGTSYKDHAKLKLKMPQNVNFGIQQVITDRLTLMMDIAWTQWSTMKELTTTFERGPLVKKNTVVMDWHDAWRFSFGGEYKLTDKWTLRCGTTFDQRAVTKKENKSVMLPDSNRVWLCFGASYQWNEHLRLDAGWNHIFFHRSHAKQSLSSEQYIRGTYRGYTDLVSLGVKYEF